MHRLLIACSFAAVLATPDARGAPQRHPEDPLPPPARLPREGPEDELRIPATFEALFPDRARRLRELGRVHPEMFRKALRSARRMARELEELRETDLGEFEQRVKTFRKAEAAEAVARKMRDAPDGEARARLRKELRAALEEVFDLKERAQRDRVERMERELQTLKERLDKRHRSRDAIVERRLRELEEGDDLEL